MSEGEKRALESGDTDQQATKKRRHGDEISFRLLFHQDSVGRVIGRNGDNLKSCREGIPRAHVRVPEAPSSANNRDRILMVTCPLPHVSQLMKKITPSIFTALEGSTTREFMLLVPTELAGAVLGKGGAQLARIRESHGVRVRMFKDRLPYCDERVLFIQGSEDKVDSMIEALIAVLEILQENELVHDFIRYTPYVAQQSDYMSRDCGGYQKQLCGEKMNMSIGRDGQLTHQGGDLRGAAATDAQQQGYQGYNQYSSSNDYSSWYTGTTQPANMEQQIWENYMASIQPPPPADHYRSRSPGRDYDQRRGRDDRSGRGDRQARSRSPMGENITDTVVREIVIQDNLTSLIIGPKGSTIGAVRNKTSAKIKIGDDETVTNGQRVVTITGSNSEVNWATNQVKRLILDAEDEGSRSNNPNNLSFSSPPQRYEDAKPYSKLFDIAKSVLPFTASTDKSDDKISKEIKIPNSNAGMVIGKKAAVINEIRNFSNCKVLIAKDSEVADDLRVIQITGTPRDVHLADYLITAVQQMPRDLSQAIAR